MNIFVYGTLTKGLDLSYALDHAKFLGHSLISGELYDLGSFPGLKKTTDPQAVVYGELYAIDDQILAHLDRLEGYDPTDLNASMYIRQNVSVTCFDDGSKVDAQVYVYQRDVTTQPLISHGDYRRYLQEKQEEPHWYLAYGSNMSSERLLARIYRVHDLQVGYLEGYQLVFNKKNLRWGTAANLSYRGHGYRCPFVAYGLDLADLQQLDLHEGEPSHYVRLGLPFTTKSGKTFLGHIYLAHPNLVIEEKVPASEYMNHIYCGYQEHDFETSFDGIACGND